MRRRNVKLRYTATFGRHRGMWSRRSPRRGAGNPSLAWWVLGAAVLLPSAVLGYQHVKPVWSKWTAIRQVSISGLQHLRRDEILAQMDLPPQSSLFGIDAGQIRQRVEAHPWVASAEVGRVIPDTLTLTITERRAAAILRNQGYKRFIDHEGRILSDGRVSLDRDLPILEGIGFSLLVNGDHDSLDRVRRGIRVAEWLMHKFETRPILNLSDPQDVIADVQGLQFRFNSLVEEQWRRYQILESTIHASVKSGRREIDLRYPGKVIVRPRG